MPNVDIDRLAADWSRWLGRRVTPHQVTESINLIHAGVGRIVGRDPATIPPVVDPPVATLPKLDPIRLPLFS